MSDLDNEWAEYPQKVFDDMMWDSFKKGFWFGIGFSILLFVVFVLGIISTK